jgi:hypothetical protein
MKPARLIRGSGKRGGATIIFAANFLYPLTAGLCRWRI